MHGKGDIMLELKKITKVYKTENLKQTALDHVSVNFRPNEFAAILGPSGSGKTTLLNIIGGLDHYDSGDLVINEVSTKKYKDRDWDSYRNHRVGFVFQSYNLISHQSVLQNVELALTLSGVSKKERKKRAKKALTEVGLKDHIYKRPNQLSGGQMQRVAIARALVNDPDILLADEPTGALDSLTSKQIMNLLSKVAKDKLVIMVTHNPELAEEYATRIIRLKDGEIIDDSNPYNGKENTKEALEIEKKKSKKTSMNLKTALTLSLNNLMTKKGRTFLTAFAGSIGIIGIALILSLSSGVQNYIDKTEKETLASYPLLVEKRTMDLNNLIDSRIREKKVTCEENKICTIDDISNSPELAMSMSIAQNNLKKLKEYFDQNGGNINSLVTDIQYQYNMDLQIYDPNTENGITKINPNTFHIAESASSNTMSFNFRNQNAFTELINNRELWETQYEILSGKFPESLKEMVLIVDENNQIPISLMYSLNVENRAKIKELIEKSKHGETFELDTIQYDFNQFIGQKFKLVLNADYYQKQGNYYIDKQNDTEYMKNLIQNGMDIEIVGIIRVKKDTTSAISGYVGYTHELATYMIQKGNETEIGTSQLGNKDINVLTNTPFDGILTSYENNLNLLGIADLTSPDLINIYPKDFDSKEAIMKLIEEYNNQQEDIDKVVYNDYVGVLLSSVTSIVNVISYVLIAFVAVSLIVSSIMIAIITYISVLERTKEIGILRAIGASKKDISRVFNAETIIEGFVAGVLGILVAFLLTIPINALVRNALEIKEIAHLPFTPSIALIIISVILTVIAGIIPSRMASKKDPVEALRSE